MGERKAPGDMVMQGNVSGNMADDLRMYDMADGTGGRLQYELYADRTGGAGTGSVKTRDTVNGTARQAARRADDTADAGRAAGGSGGAGTPKGLDGSGGGLDVDNYVRVNGDGSNSANLGNKLDYLFGKASGNTHNIQRSQSMQAELSRIGIYDNSTGREYLTQHLNDVLNDPNNISNVEIRSYIAKELPGQPIANYTATTRESFLMGSGGGVKLRSVWDGDRLLTVVIEAGE